jgi:hypothetical protein
VAGLLALVAAPAWAGDGRIEINQVIALAGGVTGSLADDPPGFPVTLAQPGSYVLTGNLSNPSLDTDSIVASVAGVTLDLNGFTVSGPRTCTSPDPDDCTGTGSGSGIVLVTGGSVRNGTVRGHGRWGISFGGVSTSTADLVEKMIVIENGSFGVGIHGGVVRDSVVASNGGNGIGTGAGHSIIEGCVVKNNKGNGLLVAAATVIRGNTIAENEGSGMGTLPAGNGHVVIGNVVLGNAGFGAFAFDDAAFHDNVFKGNQEPQIRSLSDSQFTGNRVDGTVDFEVFDPSGFSHNTMTTITGDGIDQGGNVCGTSTTCP